MTARDNSSKKGELIKREFNETKGKCYPCMSKGQLAKPSKKKAHYGSIRVDGRSESLFARNADCRCG